MFTLIQHGEVYAPEPIGQQSILLAGEKIVLIGTIDTEKLLSILECQVVDARNCFVVPGLIDSHAHLIGAGGEEGFASRMPEINLSQLVKAGITTVIGLLGTDTTTRHLTCLHAKTCQLWDEGLTAYMYSGGFELPPSTITGSIMDDVVIIDKIIGAGEIAISDYRWVDPKPYELAMLVKQAMLGGMMSGKAGVTHFHVGSGEGRLGLLNTLLDEYDVPPYCLYPTHIGRSEALMKEAIALAKRGCFVDIDTTENNLAQWLGFYREYGGPFTKLTVSSDAYTPGGAPQKLYCQFATCVRDEGFSLTDVLPLFTSNVAQVLKLTYKGKLAEGKDADVLILEKESLAVKHLWARGRLFIEEGNLVRQSKQEEQMEQSNTC